MANFAPLALGVFSFPLKNGWDKVVCTRCVFFLLSRMGVAVFFSFLSLGGNHMYGLTGQGVSLFPGLSYLLLCFFF